MATPLTDAINALTTYANSVTGESDTTLSDAVYSLAEGYGQGGITQGLEITAMGASGYTTAMTWHGDVPKYGLNYLGWNLPSVPFPVLTFDGTETLGAGAISQAKVNLNTQSLSCIKYASGFVVATNATEDRSSDTLYLSEFTGLAEAGGSAPNDIFRTTTTTYYKGYYLPKCTRIGTYWWYGHKVANIEVQIGSVGYGVTSCGTQPFGTAQGSGTITVYCNGTNLDTIKTKIMGNIHTNGNYSFVFKASENTTYGGQSYTAGDTILTA